MWPTITLPGVGITLRSYSLFLVAGWFAFALVGRRLLRGRPEALGHLHWLLLGLAVAETAGAEVLGRLMGDGPAFSGARPLGVRPWGGPLVFAAGAAIYVLCRRVVAYPLWDAAAIAFAASLVCRRLGGLASGAEVGRQTPSPLGIVTHAPFGDLNRMYPTALYGAIFYLLAAIGLAVLYARGRLKGRLAFLLGLMCCLWRPLVALLESGDAPRLMDGSLTVEQAGCLLGGAFCLAILAPRLRS